MYGTAKLYCYTHISKVHIKAVHGSAIPANFDKKASEGANKGGESSENRKIVINISGQLFVTTSKTLLKYPETRLGKLASQEAMVLEHFFETDAEIFKEILKFYRKNSLHRPKYVCFSDFEEDLKFWQIDESYISDCCSRDSK